MIEGPRQRRRRADLLGFVAACLAMFAFAAPASAADDAAWLYDPNTVVEIDLGLEEAQLAALEAAPDKHVSGTFTARVAGETKGVALTNVGIRLKGGHGSFRELSRKPAFKVKFDKFVKGQLFFGLEGITLNNMVQDRSMVHEALTYDLFRSLGLVAPRTGYALTRLNGEVIGVHANIEQYDDISLPRLFDSTQHLYEADLPKVDVVTGGASTFEVDEGDEEDRADLEALIAAVNAKGGSWSDGMAAVADLEQMTRVWAVERYVGHWDGYAGEAGVYRPNNYYLHSDDAGIFRMVPWGTDQTWQSELRFGEAAGGIMFNRCLADAPCKQLYVQALTALEALEPSLDFLAKAQAYAAMLGPFQELEPEARREHTEAQISEGLEVTEDFIRDRPEQLREFLATVGSPEPPVDPGDPDPLLVVVPIPGGTGDPARAPDRAIAKFGATRRPGSRIETVARATVAGKVIQRVRVRRDGRWAFGCSVGAAVHPRHRLRLSCRLPDEVLAARADRAQVLRVQLDYVPASGERRSVTRIVRLPRGR